MTVATLLLTCLIFLLLGWTAPSYYITALSVGGIVCIAASNAGTTSQDLKTGFLIGATPRLQQISILIGALGSALILGPILMRLNAVGAVYVPPITYEAAVKTAPIEAARFAQLPLYTNATPTPGPWRLLKVNAEQTEATATMPTTPRLVPGEYLVQESGVPAWKVRRNFPTDLKPDTTSLGPPEKLAGSQAASDKHTYRGWHKTDLRGAPAGRYLIDERGVAAYLADPGINGVHTRRPDGSLVSKFDAPKATLMSYIIKGILSQQLPWGLVLIGVMIAVVLEMSSIPSLAFAVGVYLPLSSSSPIFIGGMIRWLVDQHLKRRNKGPAYTPEQLTAEGDKGPGVLLASGYIAGGAIAGILIAFMAGVLSKTTQGITDFMSAHNPFFEGAHSDALSMIPFAILVLFLYWVGRRPTPGTKTGH